MKLSTILWIGGAIIAFFLGILSLQHRSPRYVFLAREITKKTAITLRDNYNLYLVGTGGQMMDDIQVLHMGFDFFQEVDLKKARELMVHAISEYLREINANEEVRPFLHEYPFEAKNVEVRIWFYAPDHSRLPPDKIYYSSSIDGILNYYIRGKETPTRESIYEETYEEALKRMNQSSPLK
jgi:hypothetical protein